MSEQIKWMNKSCLCHVGGRYYEGGNIKAVAVGIIVGASKNKATWICWKVNKKKQEVDFQFQRFAVLQRK